MSTCGNCANWRLSGDLGKLGYGLCDVQTDPMLALSLRTSEHNECRIAGFKAKAIAEDDEIDMERLEKLSYGGSD